MNVVYVDGQQTRTVPSIFLAGPTPRSIKDQSWRPDALEIFQELGFDGTIFVPERSDWESNFDYYSQVEWEWASLHWATVIMFWVPRKLPEFPAFTTNVEFGFYLAKRPERCVYGRPPSSEKNSYLDWMYKQNGKGMPYLSLVDTIEASIELAKSFT